MTGQQIKLLSKIKKLVSQGKRRFIVRNDRNYIDALLEIGITEDEAWNYILSLNKHFYFPDTMPNYYATNDTLTFKRKINEKMVYIKIKIEKKQDEEAVCLSFHIDVKELIK